MAVVLPPVPTFTAGEDLLSSDMSRISDALTFANRGRPLVSLHQSLTQQVPTNTVGNIFVQMDVTDLDNVGGHSTTDNSRYVCQLAGWYQVNAVLAMKPSTAGAIYVSLFLNGANILGSAQQTANLGANSNTIAHTSKLVHMNVNDYVQVLGSQNSGGPLGTATNDVSALDAVWISL